MNLLIVVRLLFTEKYDAWLAPFPVFYGQSCSSYIFLTTNLNLYLPKDFTLRFTFLELKRFSAIWLIFVSIIKNVFLLNYTICLLQEENR